MMGSGGLIVMDDETCMVDIARFFMEFTQDESCGKCTPCRVGTRRILEILNKICDGRRRGWRYRSTGTSYAKRLRPPALCGLGQGAPNPVETILKSFPG